MDSYLGRMHSVRFDGIRIWAGCILCDLMGFIFRQDAFSVI